MPDLDLNAYEAAWRYIRSCQWTYQAPIVSPRHVKLTTFLRWRLAMERHGR